MFEQLPQIIEKLSQSDPFDSLKNTHRGVEKESLRIDEAGYLSQLAHPKAVGSAFTHGEITTDFSESLFEFITAPSSDLHAAMNDLFRIHQFTNAHLQNEMLWPCSMPCLLTEDEEVPLAYYGKSNLAKLKTLYRKGLGLRYGRAMQAIAGVHYNLSFDETFLNRIHVLLSRAPTKHIPSDAYFGIIRNYHRVSWMIPYLFGASPAVCPSFFAHEPERFPIENKSHYANPYAVALRLSDIGYINRTHEKMRISYDNIQAYVDSLKKALLTVDPYFKSLGVKKGDEWLQLNANVLQIEAEYYGSVRPKRIPRPLERIVHALNERGVEYIEVRTLDLYPFSPVGIDERSLRFLDVLLLSALLIESPVIGAEEQKQIDGNFRKVVNEGRRPGLLLQSEGRSIALAELGHHLIKNLSVSANLLDGIHHTHDFSDALKEAAARFADPRRLPSYQLIDRIEAAGGSFFQASMALARQHFDTLSNMPLADAVFQKMLQQADASWQRHKAIESLPEAPFDQFMADYFDPTRL